MIGLVLDTSALVAYASRASFELGALLAHAEEDPDVQVWLPALCLGQAQLDVAGTPAAGMIDLLLSAELDLTIAPYDVSASRLTARIAAAYGVPLDLAHAVVTAVLQRSYLVTADPRRTAAVAPPSLPILDLTVPWA